MGLGPRGGFGKECDSSSALQGFILFSHRFLIFTIKNTLTGVYFIFL